MSNIIELKQKPIIAYDLIEAKGKEIAQRIATLDIDNIEANENNLKIIKSTRAELSREFKDLEEKRKMVKDMILKPYNDFEAAYKEHIACLFKDADATLKEKVAAVESEILQRKIEAIKTYFDEHSKHEWLTFDDIGLNIIRSKSDKFYKDQIDEYLGRVEADLQTIETLEHKERVLAKYQRIKDLAAAIAEVNIEIQREEAIRKQREEQERLKKEREEASQKKEAEQDRAYVETVAPQMAATQASIQQPEPQIEMNLQPSKRYRATFTITATMEQMAELKQFMQQKGITYESVK
ncbi:DUF1351 domain-containing protein [Hydrogenimonas urashimensis]|uniref:DUF1351 domain-containing protein n=1 Tax=Hydrogenimonas urashimensis TaxID=2740515 RepID=UPI0019159DFB|nr:DUF1351 domain-containing protein [Hydrogenimonas urashimensis]